MTGFIFERMQLFKDSMVNCASNSAIYGLPNIARTNITCLRLTWALLLIGSLTGCAYLMVLSVFEYFEYNVTTAVRMYGEDSMNFPAIKVCQSSPFISEKGVEYLSDKILEDDKVFSIDPDYLNFEIVDRKFRGQDKLATLTREPNVTAEMRAEFGYSLEEFVLSCSFYSNPCKKADWLRVFDSYAGNCFVFNSGLNGSVNTIDLPGEWSSLRLHLYLSDQGYYYFNKAVQVYVYDQKSRRVKSAKASALPGYESAVILKQTVAIKEPRPYSNCTLDIVSNHPKTKEILEILQKSHYDYSKKDCMTVCLKQAILKKCWCNVVYEPIIKTAPSCLNSTQYDCYYSELDQLYNQSTEYDQCDKLYCPERCDRTTYDLNVMTASLSELDIYQANKTFVQLRPNTSFDAKNLISLNVYYEELSYTEIREQPSVTLINLVSNLGGLLGLFNGLR